MLENVKRSPGFSRLPGINRRLKKRWVWQLTISVWAWIIIWGVIGTESTWGEMTRQFVVSTLSVENDWTPAIKDVFNMKSDDTAGPEQMVLPVSGIVVRNYGWYKSDSDQKQKWHGGIDIKAQKGQAVKAAAAGTVKQITGNDAQGYDITVWHNEELSSIYGNLGRVLVGPGQQIKQGEALGEVGKSEVYFEIRLKATAVDPLNYLRSNRNSI